MSELTHYRFLMSPYCARVDAALRWLELPAKRVEVHPLNKKEIAFSSSRAVPVLKDGQQVLEGAPAILRHLDGKVSGKPLYPLDPRKRTEVEELERWAEEAGPAMMWSQLFREPRATKEFLHITAQSAPLSFAEKLGWRLGAEKMLKQQTTPLLKGLSPNEAVGRWYRKMEDLADGPATWLYLLGDEMTAADLTLFSFFLILHRVNATLPGVTDFPSMAAWFQRMHGDSHDVDETTGK